MIVATDTTESHKTTIFQEANRSRRLNVLGMGLLDEGTDQSTCSNVVLPEVGLCLASLYFVDNKALTIGSPSEIGEEAVGGSTRL